MENFENLGISEPILKAIKEQGFETPTEIQEKSMKQVIDKKDVVAEAATGSGKTLAFGVGAIQNTKKEYGIQALILTPTRELAEQIANELKKFSKYHPLEIDTVYGGVSIINQTKHLEYSDIVVGTPGRILDHIQRGSIDLSKVKTLVLDEADRMLDMGFIDDVNKIIKKCPQDRQTLLFSATISQDIILLAKKYQKDPIEVSATPLVDPEKLKQVYFDVQDQLKFSLLKHLLENEESKLVMVFCNTRTNVDFVANNLNAHKIEALPIHGGFAQEKRNKIMKEFHSKDVHVLVCTDVAARGLDIKRVSHVYNYDLPADAKEYTHRIGRTARAGEEGKVINIVTGRDYNNFDAIMRNDKMHIEHKETPYIKKVELRWMPERRGYGRDSRGPSRFGRDSRGPRRDDRRSSGFSRGPRRDSRPPRRDSRGPSRPFRRDDRRRDSRSPRRDSRRDSRRDDRRRDSRGPRRDSRPPRRDSRRDSRRDNRRNNF